MINKKIVYSVFVSLVVFRISLAQSDFPSDSVMKFFSIRAEASSNPPKENIREKFMEADRVLQRIFPAGKKMIISLRYTSNFHVIDEVKSNYYVTFYDNDKLIVLWFRRQTKDIKPEFVSANDLISQIEKTEENAKIELEVEVMPSGCRSSTYIQGEGTKLWIHAKLLSVKPK